MKLCILTQNAIKGDGQGRVNYEVIRESLQRGQQVTVLSTQVAPELQQHDRLRWIPIAVQQFPTALGKDLAYARQTANWLRRYRSEFDIVQINGANTDSCSDVNAVHFVYSAWGRSPYHLARQRQDAYGAYQQLYTTLNARWEKQAFSRAKVVVAVSSKIKQELIDVGVAPERIRVILNGVDVQEFHPGNADRAALELREAVPLALFVGDIRTNRKNLDSVLQALVQSPQLHLAVVGATEHSPYLELARQLGLSDRVQFLGFRRDVAEIMRAVDLFVFPSRYEACTLVLLEAMASGLPVITAATTGGVELVTPECGIVLADPNDVSLLAQALNQLAIDPQRRDQMGQASRAVAEQHSWSIAAQDYIRLFQEVSESCR